MGGQRHALAALPPGKRTGTHFIGDFFGPQAGLEVCGKFRRTLGFDPRIVQPVTNHRTGLVILAHNYTKIILTFSIY